MQRIKEIPTNPRFNLATTTAYDFLTECGFNSFPISSFDVLKELSDYVIVLPWPQAKDILKSEDPFHLKANNSDARTIRDRNSGKYMIIYDDDIQYKSAERVNWTLIHEVGHILLGHLTDFNKTALNRGGITQAQYGVLEIEANYFAAQFLMPTPILTCFKDVTVEEMSLLFGVSEEAAAKKFNRIFVEKRIFSDEFNNTLIRNFYDFIVNDVDSTIFDNIYHNWGFPKKQAYTKLCRKCPTCFTYINDSNLNFCPNCGTDLNKRIAASNYLEYFKFKNKIIRTPGVNHPFLPYIDECDYPRQFMACPNCLSTETTEDGLYCKNCHTPLFNYCLKDKVMLNPSDRFCPKCGAESSFKDYYTDIEKRILKIRNFNPDADNLVKYPYEEYFKWLFRISDDNNNLYVIDMALTYSSIFNDDNDDIYIFTDNENTKKIIENNKTIISEKLQETDQIKRNNIYIDLIK